MNLSSAAGLLCTALIAIYVTLTKAAPTPDAEAVSLAAPSPDPVPAPNCMLEGMGVNSKKLGSLLNLMLKLNVQLLYNNDDPCKKKEIMGKMEKAMEDMKCFMKDAPKESQGLLEGILGPLLRAVEELLQALLGSEGVLGAVSDLLSRVINLLLCLLSSLGLKVDLDLVVQIGNLLNLDLSALLSLG